MILHVTESALSGVYHATLPSRVFGDLSLDRVLNVNYTWTHPEWNIDISRTFIVFWQDTSRDLCDLYMREEIMWDIQYVHKMHFPAAHIFARE